MNPGSAAPHAGDPPRVTDAHAAAREATRGPAAPGSRGGSDAVLLTSLIVLCVGARCMLIARIPYCAEDAYITFRYALNWAHGLGPVYNAGERAWGFTSPLWTSLLALMAVARAPLELAARTALVACDVLTLVLAWRLLRERSRLAAVAFGAFFALWPRLAQMPATGLESSLVTCLLLAAASFGRTRWGGLLNGVLALSRPEGALMSAILAWRLSSRQRWVWLGVAALQGCFMIYFASLLPSSVSSKSTVYGIQLFKGLYWLEWLIPGIQVETLDGLALAPISLLILTGLIAAVAHWRRVADDSPLPALFGCGLLVLAIYMATGAPWFYWYAPAPMVAIFATACFGLGTAGALRWMLVPLLVAIACSWGNLEAHVLRRQTHDVAVFANLGRTLRADAAGRAGSVLLEPIGLIGYLSGLRVLDEVGLVTPWIAEERRKGDGWYARVIEREHPDYVVIRRDWLKGQVSWAGVGAPFASPEQAVNTMRDYEPVRTRVETEDLPAGAGTLLLLRRKH